MFVNREKELGMLEERYTKGNPEFLVIYGRRRVGKTELIRHFVKPKPHIYFLADKRSQKEQLELFSRLCSEYFSDSLLLLQPFNSWDSAFTYLSQKIESSLILVFDEFPYLVEINPALPSTEENPAKSRKGIYLLKDTFFKFWFRFVYPNLSYLEEGKQDYVMDIIKRDFDTYLGPIFEAIAREYLIYSIFKDKSPIPFDKIGAFWDSQEEIDIVGLNEEGKNIFLGECKWTNKPVDRNVFFSLIQKKERITWYKNERKEYFCICSKKGFTEQMKMLAEEKGVLLIDFSENFSEKRQGE